MKLFLQKMQNFQALGLRPLAPVPPAAGGFVPRTQNAAPPLRISGYAPATIWAKSLTKFNTKVQILNCN